MYTVWDVPNTIQYKIFSSYIIYPVFSCLFGIMPDPKRMPYSVPGISDHCAVVIELDIDPPYRHTKPSPVRQFKKANWEAIRQQIRSCWTSFSENSPSRSVNENWLKLESILNQCLDKFIQTKMTSTRENLPWLSNSLLASIRKKTSLYSKAKRMNKADLWSKYKLCKRQTQRAIRSARWSFLKKQTF